MKRTGTRPNGASPLFSDAEWRGLTKAEQSRWFAFRTEHPGSEWRPLCRAIIELGYRLPPTEAEAGYLWPIVEARPNEAADWFRDAGRPQGLLRLQPSWAIVLRAVSLRWFAFTDSIPADEDNDWRTVRDLDDSRAVLRRIGWYRDP